MGYGSWWAVVLMGVLALVAGGLAWRFFFMRRRTTAASPAGLAGQTPVGVGFPAPRAPRVYSPGNVGNDASARPWETPLGVAEAAAGGGGNGVAQGEQPRSGVPADFDAEGFLQASKSNFINLQAAWDRSDIPALRAMMTDGMLAQIQAQLTERERLGAGGGQTEVVVLDAQLLGIEALDGDYLASVEFSGLMREDASAGPNPFREVWNITRPRSGGGWLVSGVQALA